MFISNHQNLYSLTPVFGEELTSCCFPPVIKVVKRIDIDTKENKSDKPPMQTLFLVSVDSFPIFLNHFSGNFRSCLSIIRSITYLLLS
jgi:hypothetical protein